MSDQDWKPVVLTKKKPTGGLNGVPKSAEQARRMGMAVDTVKKQGGGYNAQRMGKLENETEELQHKKVGGEVKKAIMQGRLAKKLTQAQLAQQINEKPQIIQEYESGKAIPNQQVLSKMERILGVKLRGLK